MQINQHQNIIRNRLRQKGSTLVISLLMLIIMTLLGLTSMGTAGLEEKMAGNNRDLMIAFEAAEAALKEGENYVYYTLVTTNAFSDTVGDALYELGELDDPGGTVAGKSDVSDESVWTGAFAYTSGFGNVATQPKYIIELISTVGNDDLNIQGYGESSGVGVITSFRITSRGTGGSDNAKVLLQSSIGRKF